MSPQSSRVRCTSRSKSEGCTSKWRWRTKQSRAAFRKAALKKRAKRAKIKQWLARRQDPRYSVNRLKRRSSIRLGDSPEEKQDNSSSDRYIPVSRPRSDRSGSATEMYDYATDLNSERDDLDSDDVKKFDDDLSEKPEQGDYETGDLILVTPEIVACTTQSTSRTASSQSVSPKTSGAESDIFDDILSPKGSQDSVSDSQEPIIKLVPTPIAAAQFGNGPTFVLYDQQDGPNSDVVDSAHGKESTNGNIIEYNTADLLNLDGPAASGPIEHAGLGEVVELVDCAESPSVPKCVDPSKSQENSDDEYQTEELLPIDVNELVGLADPAKVELNNAVTEVVVAKAKLAEAEIIAVTPTKPKEMRNPMIKEPRPTILLPDDGGTTAIQSRSGVDLSFHNDDFLQAVDYDSADEFSLGP